MQFTMQKYKNTPTYNGSYSSLLYSLLETRPRPILIKLIRISDVSKILSKKGLLSRPHSIKSDMSREQRLLESILMKVRWGLIQSGVARKSIKIRNTCLFVNNKLHGQVINSKFQCESPILSSQPDTRHCPKNVADVIPILVAESHQSGSHVLTSSGVPVVEPNTSSDNLMNSCCVCFSLTLYCVRMRDNICDVTSSYLLA